MVCWTPVDQSPCDTKENAACPPCRTGVTGGTAARARYAVRVSGAVPALVGGSRWESGADPQP
ncbi:hypothetical protein GCM10023347_39470 [Streptomyces chumphonensis]